MNNMLVNLPCYCDQTVPTVVSYPHAYIVCLLNTYCWAIVAQIGVLLLSSVTKELASQLVINMLEVFSSHPVVWFQPISATAHKCKLIGRFDQTTVVQSSPPVWWVAAFTSVCEKYRMFQRLKLIRLLTNTQYIGSYTAYHTLVSYWPGQLYFQTVVSTQHLMNRRPMSCLVLRWIFLEALR